jgi:hypothetical protein
MARLDEPAAYRVTIQGCIGKELLDESGPVQINELQVDAPRGTTTLAGIFTDQVGLVGLLRQLHGLGIVLLAVERLDCTIQH